jgi:lipoprotein-anchoring transpeptidase ErfK/SrfK
MPEPDRRPPPVRLDLSPKAKNRPPKSKPPKRPGTRKRKPGASGGDSNLLYWIAGGLVALLIVLGAIDYEIPEIKSWFAGSQAEVPPENLLPLPQKPSPPPQPSEEEDARLQKQKENAAEQKRFLAEHPASKPLPPKIPTAPPNKPVVKITKPSPPTEVPPPLVQPVPIGAIPGAPARALPLDSNILDTERIAAYQVALERIHFSCGFIDGDQGMRTQRMLRAFQTSRGLPVTGFLDQPTRDAIGEPGEPFLTYTVTADDVASIMPKPQTWIAKSKATRLGYNDIWEMLAEKFHCTRAYLKDLNRGVTTPVAGTEVIGPKVYPAARIPQAASLRIILSETSLEALDASGKIIAFFPCSIAKDKNKRPHGLLTVKVVDPHPDYTFDPALFADAAKAEGITHKMTIPPGPRNPVGTTWVGLSLPGYGIHGTPDPEAISRTQSHGCFRLANWNAEKVLKMVHVGTPVDVEP